VNHASLKRSPMKIKINAFSQLVIHKLTSLPQMLNVKNARYMRFHSLPLPDEARKKVQEHSNV